MSRNKVAAAQPPLDASDENEDGFHSAREEEYDDELSVVPILEPQPHDGIDGVKEVHATLLLLGSLKPVNVPLTQEPAPMTEDIAAQQMSVSSCEFALASLFL